MFNKSHSLLITLLPVLLLTGCVQNTAYRTDYQLCVYSQSGDCADRALQHHTAGLSDDYYLSFVEFDNQGQLRDREQLHKVMDAYLFCNSSNSPTKLSIVLTRESLGIKDFSS